MAERTLTVWCDPEGDCLEVIFDQRPGFSVLRIGALGEKPLEISL